MADDGPVTFYGACKDAFYFDAAESVVDGDTFYASQSLACSIRCRDNMVLLVNAGGQFRLQHLMTSGQCSTECKFYIHVYRDDSPTVCQGNPVMLYTEKDGRKLVACCRENNEIYPEVMDLPEEIGESPHKALFQMVLLKDNTYMFQSTTITSRFLGFTHVDGNPSLKKLVLCCKGADGVNESAEVILDGCDA